MIALTFDDGPYMYNTDLIQQFETAGAKLTLFVNGNNWDCIYNYATQLQTAYSHGHQIGSHTWSHPDITTLSASQFQLELSKLETAFSKILGTIPTYFRPPYGSYNQSSLSVLTAMHYRYSAIWDIDSGDANGNTVAQSESDIQSGFASGNDYHIVLDHETQSSTVSQIVPWLLNLVKSKGLKAVTLAECLGDQYSPYRPTTGLFGTNDSTWQC